MFAQRSQQMLTQIHQRGGAAGRLIQAAKQFLARRGGGLLQLQHMRRRGQGDVAFRRRAQGAFGG